MQTYEWFRPGLSLDQELRRWYTLVGSEECYRLSVNEGPDTPKIPWLTEECLEIRVEVRYFIWRDKGEHCPSRHGAFKEPPGNAVNAEEVSGLGASHLE